MKNRTIEWVVTGICAVLTVLVCVTATVLLTHDPDEPAAKPVATAPPPATSAQPGPEKSPYHLDHIGNACELIDTAPFTAYQPLDQANPPRNTETRGDEPSLDCYIRLAEFGSLTLRVDQMPRDPRDRFDSFRKVHQNLNQNVHQQSGSLPGLGTENFFIAGERRNTYYADDVSIDYQIGVLDADITVVMSASVSGFGKGLTIDKIARPVQDQVRAVLTRLRR
ncbi:hypothetical protein [Nocardia barduliensis]|uniref:hypothetical protein n=1 Tax=Nocardia barduliensis TaxID=2736643 RepID=UPI001574C873|nr:hypothetical protein [Nocardia barduliensis]